MDKQQYINNLKNKIAELESKATLTAVQVIRMAEAKEYIRRCTVNE